MQASDVFVSKDEWQQMAPGVRRKILGYDEHLMMVVVEFEPGAVGAVHNHPHRQVTYVASGEFEVTVDGKSQVLKAGESFFVAPSLPHGVVSLTGGTLVDVFTPVRSDFIA